MVKSNVETIVIVNLKLDSKIAKWLMEECQNPRPGDVEGVRDNKKEIFDSLNGVFSRVGGFE